MSRTGWTITIDLPTFIQRVQVVPSLNFAQRHSNVSDVRENLGRRGPSSFELQQAVVRTETDRVSMRTKELSFCCEGRTELGDDSSGRSIRTCCSTALQCGTRHLELEPGR